MSIRWSEADLKSYQARQIGVIGELPDRFGFVLDRPFLLLNRLLKLHWAARSEYAADLSSDVAAATRHLPQCARPICRARVTITRYGIQMPDQDGLTGGCKPLLDALLVRSPKHPNGLGLIVDDSPTHLELVARSEKVATRKEQRTVVLIERIKGEAA